jgi:hypothetical protein
MLLTYATGEPFGCSSCHLRCPNRGLLELGLQADRQNTGSATQIGGNASVPAAARLHPSCSWPVATIRTARWTTYRLLEHLLHSHTPSPARLLELLLAADTRAPGPQPHSEASHPALLALFTSRFTVQHSPTHRNTHQTARGSSHFFTSVGSSLFWGRTPRCVP